jgi:diacylglycerol O-acyltransferase / wax synthase
VPSPATAVRAARAAVFMRRLLPAPAPRTVLNVPIGAARRCAAGSWSSERVGQIAKATGAADNDVVLAVCAGGLRGYLLEQHALPDRSLVAMVPVSLRPTGRTDGEASGNQLAVLLCPLATDEADPIRRLEAITAATTRGKQFYRSLPASVATALSGLLLSPIAAAQMPGMTAWTPPPFNLVISNVPRPRDTLYWHGARLDACHPLSIPMHGLALNITVAGTATSLDVGITSCRNALPHPGRLLEHLDRSLTALEDHC